MWFLYKFLGIALFAVFDLWLTWKVVTDRVLPKDPPAKPSIADRYKD